MKKIGRRSPFTSVKLCAAIYFYNLATAAFGQTTMNREAWLSGEVYVSPQRVYNATGVAEEDEQVNETQLEYGATLSSLIETQATTLDLNYDYVETRYDQETQPDDAYWQGNSDLILGTDTTFYQLSANHSIRRVLNAPELFSGILANSDSREIMSVSPLLRTRLGEANTLGALYTFMTVSFDQNDQSDSTREGIDIIYTRRLTPIREASLIVSTREIDYDTSDEGDYESESAVLQLDVEQRNYDYRIGVGYTEITPLLGEKGSSPTFDLRINSALYGNQLTLFVNRSISDSSLGSGNSEFFSSEISFDGGLTERDQIKRSTAGVSWTYAELCSNCVLAANVGLERVEYFQFDNNDSRQNFFDVAFTYDISQSLTVLASHRLTETRFEPVSARDDTENMITRLEMRYALGRHLDFALMLERDTRKVENRDNIDVDSIIFTTTYHFE